MIVRYIGLHNVSASSRCSCLLPIRSTGIHTVTLLCHVYSTRLLNSGRVDTTPWAKRGGGDAAAAESEPLAAGGDKDDDDDVLDDDFNDGDATAERNRQRQDDQRDYDGEDEEKDEVESASDDSGAGACVGARYVSAILKS